MQKNKHAAVNEGRDPDTEDVRDAAENDRVARSSSKAYEKTPPSKSKSETRRVSSSPSSNTSKESASPLQSKIRSYRDKRLEKTEQSKAEFLKGDQSKPEKGSKKVNIYIMDKEKKALNKVLESLNLTEQ